MAEEIFNLKDEVLKVASAKNHAWTDDDFDGDPYGKADPYKYGHVKLLGYNNNNNNDDSNETFEEQVQTHKDNPAVSMSISGLQYYIAHKMPSIVWSDDTDENEDLKDDGHLITAYKTRELINELIAQAKTELTSDNIKVAQTVTDENTHESTTQNITLTQKLQNLDTFIQSIDNPNNIDLTNPKSVETNINDLIIPGYYYYNKAESSELSYHNNKINYQNAIILVERQPDATILQYIYATKQETNDLTPTIDGTKYLRTSTDNGATWSNLSLVYTPPQSLSVYPTRGDIGTRITITETTAGFIFNWTQTNDANNSYPIQEDLYEYETIGTFAQLPIGDAPYIFGNLIGKVDVRITKDEIAVRSTLSSGSIVKNVNASFFVPRIE